MGEKEMKIHKNFYYVVAIGKKYSFGRCTSNRREAHNLLGEARRAYPCEKWGIMVINA